MYKFYTKLVYNYNYYVNNHIEFPCTYCKKLYLFPPDTLITPETTYFCSVNCLINDYGNKNRTVEQLYNEKVNK
jgi:hypothetical protein